MRHDARLGLPVIDAELVHPVPVAEAAPWARAMATTFLEDPSSPRWSHWIDALARRWEAERMWGARAGERWVATLRTMARTLSVPGLDTATRDLRVDALTNVTVAATHRRRGILTALLTDSLRAARERGDALSMLISAEWPIYGRFGYAPATLRADYSLRVARTGSRVPGEPGRVRQVERDEFVSDAPAVFAAARRLRAGQVDRDGSWWPRTLGTREEEALESPATNWFVHDGDHGIDGLLGWSPRGRLRFIPPHGSVDVWDLIAATNAAYRDLWAYLSGLDGVEEVTLSNRPVDEPVRWLLPDARTLVMTEQVDFLWLRLLDVPAALSARRYAVPGKVVLDVVDEATGGFAAGRFALRADGDTVECTASRAAPDLVLAQSTLASIYLGGFRLHELRLGAMVQECTPGALARVALMFSTPRAPWNATSF